MLGRDFRRLAGDFIAAGGGFHGNEAALTPAESGEVFDETVFDASARFELRAEGLEQGGEQGRLFAFDEDDL